MDSDGCVTKPLRRFAQSAVSLVSADALQETGVAELPARDDPITGIARRLPDAGQQRLDERINEREQSLLCQLEAADLAANKFQTRSEFSLSGIDAAVALDEFPLYSCACRRFASLERSCPP